MCMTRSRRDRYWWQYVRKAFNKRSVLCSIGCRCCSTFTDVLWVSANKQSQILRVSRLCRKTVQRDFLFWNVPAGNTAQQITQHNTTQQNTLHNTTHYTTQHNTLHNTTQHITQHNTTHYTTQHNTTQCITKHNTLHNTIQHNVLQNTTQHNTLHNNTTHYTTIFVSSHQQLVSAIKTIFRLNIKL